MTSVPTRRGAPSSAMTESDLPIVVLKIGGELLEHDEALKRTARIVGRAARRTRLVVVHGGGKEIDAALATAAIPKHQIDGLRITDERTLQVVVAVLAGTINTHFVATVNAAGGQAVGLTGADAGVGRVKRARWHRTTTGELVDLGRVGHPVRTGPAPLIDTLIAGGFTPVIACVGASRDGRLFNVNADTLATSIAGRISAARLVFAGGTAGVLDASGDTIPRLGAPGIRRLLVSGTATAGMVAKLHAARDAVASGVRDVVIADGRTSRLEALLNGTAPRDGAWTRVGEC